MNPLQNWITAGKPDPFAWSLANGVRVLQLFDQMREAGVEWSEPKQATKEKWRKGVQQTFTGKPFDFFDPDPDMICIEDIAHSLAMKCRYNGHTWEFYSVAQHSVIVAEHVSQQYTLLGLLHDASEAYGGDLPGPLKELPQFQFYRDAEALLTEMIMEKFDVYRTSEGWAHVNEIDKRIVRDESDELLEGAWEWNRRCGEMLLPDGLWVQKPEAAKSDFLDVFELCGKPR